ncbi:MAG: SPFH domain-containing protein [Chloroflexaceae bacterium]
MLDMLQDLGLVIGVIIVAVLLVFFTIIALISRFYVKAPADRAFVKTGQGKTRVVLNGGGWVFPALHEITWVDLRTMDIDIERTEDNALLTIDPQYADIRAIFYIKVNPIAEDIERAARTVGGDEVNTDSVKRLVESKLEGALRDVAATFTLMSLHQEREKFVERVQNLVRADLSENGLVLESVSITALKSARQGSFGIDDVFGAQVARANAEVIQRALKERNEIDQTTQTEIARRNSQAEQERNEIDQKRSLEITRRNAGTRQEENDIERSAELEIATRDARAQEEKLSLERNLALAQATQRREIAIRQAEEQSASNQASYEQDQAAELARVIKERAIAEAEKQKEQAIQLAEERRRQAIELAQQEREREVQRSTVLRQQAVEVADQERQVALAQEQAKREQADRERLLILAQREEAEQQVFTVQEKAAAERDSQIQIINARRDAEREMINRRNEAEIQAYRRIKEAEAEAEALNEKADAEATAAIKMAEARRTEAQAAADAEKLRAEAAQVTAAAQGLAEADVIRARAAAARDEAEAKRALGLAEAEATRARTLAEAEGQRAMADALAAHEGVAQRLEIEKLRLSTQTEIGVAQARAMGQALAAMDFKLYGTPDTAQQILRMMSLTDGIGNLFQSAPAPVKELGERLLDRVLPGNGNGAAQGDDSAQRATTQPTPQTPAGVDPALVQPLIAEGSVILTRLLSAEERQELTLRAGVERALTLADAEQQAILQKILDLLAYAPDIAGQTVEQVLRSGSA